MISFNEALDIVLGQAESYGWEEVELADAQGRVLAETIFADRDFPPFDRATKDGIAIKYDEVDAMNKLFKSIGVAQAGSPQQTLDATGNCIEVMTGAMVPKNADTVIMYEHTRQENGMFIIEKPIKKGQNIHYQASDVQKSETLLLAGNLIGPSEIGVLATVGKSRVKVQKNPKVAVIATGNELVEVDQTPKPYQIRKSNSHTLVSILGERGIQADSFHLKDDPNIIQESLKHMLNIYDVFLLSGGVSKGKYDFLPDAFAALGIDKVFHRVRQRPGKPFWFGKHQNSNTLIFSFPGNPVSTYVNYLLYFFPWLNKTLGLKTNRFTVILEKSMENTTDLTLFKGVSLDIKDGKLMASEINTTGSGDVLSISKADGFVELKPKQTVQEGDVVPFHSIKPIN